MSAVEGRVIGGSPVGVCPGDGGARNTARGIVTRAVGRDDVTAIDTLVDALCHIVSMHGTLYAWAASLPQPRALRGRAPVYVAAVPTTNETVVVRHAWHGGLLAPLTGDRFRMPTRAPRELASSCALRRAGIPTTDIVGYARYAAGPGLRRVDVVSRWVTDAVDLGAIAAGHEPGMALSAALDATIALLAQLAAHGVIHPDLNVKNILLHRPRPDALDAMIIDVDVVRLDTSRTPRNVMQANVQRLVRSIRKWRRHHDTAISDDHVKEFVQRALGASPVRFADAAPLHGIVSDGSAP